MEDESEISGDADSRVQGPQFVLQRIYVKGLSFEAPSTPAVFALKGKPNVHVELNTKAEKSEGELYEVVLSVTVTVKSEKKLVYSVEVEQAGLFHVHGIPEDQLGPILGSHCPNILFPYAREAVSDLIARGGFSQFLLAPVNFEALYAQARKEGERKERVTH